MSGNLIPIIIIPAFFLCIGYVTRVISDNRIRRELINNNVPADLIQKLFLENRAESISANLKWGIVMFAIGLALAVIQASHLSEGEPLTYGVVFMFGGGGLLLYYVIRSYFLNDDQGS